MNKAVTARAVAASFFEGARDMKPPVSDIAFTPAVKSAQQQRGSRTNYARMEQRGGWQDRVSADLAEFIAERDSFYLGTATADGQPYIQHRGGPPGFLKVVDDRTLGFVDYSGNRQYISMSNLKDNDRAFLFLMDFARRQRIKIWGRAEVVEGDPVLMERLFDQDYKAKPERVFLFHVEAWDVNCPQHIHKRVSLATVDSVVEQARSQVQELQVKLDKLENKESQS